MAVDTSSRLMQKAVVRKMSHCSHRFETASTLCRVPSRQGASFLLPAFTPGRAQELLGARLMADMRSFLLPMAVIACLPLAP